MELSIPSEKDIVVPEGLTDVDRLIFLVRISDAAERLTRAGLYKVKQEESWKGRFSSWGEFVKSSDGLGKSESWATKHIKVHEFYTLEHGISPEELTAPTESLYLARLMPKLSVEQKISWAFKNTREEIRDEKNELEGHVHVPKTITICDECAKRLDNGN